MAGYSATPLSKKLGIKAQSRVRVEHAPDNYIDLLQPLPEGVNISQRLTSNIDIWHIFTKSKDELGRKLQTAMNLIPENGIIWVSWPKKASGVSTDMTEDRIREVALPLGLVDIKVCAVDEIWSGLKLVIRKRNRK
jgi:hypothetical protein